MNKFEKLKYIGTHKKDAKIKKAVAKRVVKKAGETGEQRAADTGKDV